MRRLIFISLIIVLIVGCSSKSDNGQKKKVLTDRQRDSVLSKSKLPGAKVVGKVIQVSDSAASRAKRLDDLSK